MSKFTLIYLKKMMKMKRTLFVYELSILFAKGALSMVGGASHAGIACPTAPLLRELLDPSAVF